MHECNFGVGAETKMGRTAKRLCPSDRKKLYLVERKYLATVETNGRAAAGVLVDPLRISL